MDIVLIVSSLIVGFIASVGVIVNSPSRNPQEKATVGACLSVLGASVFVLILVKAAAAVHNPTPKYINHSIINHQGCLFYISEGRIVELTGDKKFVDPKTTMVQTKIIPGGWSYGIYITETTSTTLVKADDVDNLINTL